MEITKGLELAGPHVNVKDLDKELAEYVQHLALLHLLLFGVNLVVTSGNDGDHAPHSEHYRNLAVDLRTKDLAADSQGLFLHVLAYSAHFRGLGVFDERALPGAGHIHLQVLPAVAR